MAEVVTREVIPGLWGGGGGKGGGEGGRRGEEEGEGEEGKWDGTTWDEQREGG